MLLHFKTTAPKGNYMAENRGQILHFLTAVKIRGGVCKNFWVQVSSSPYIPTSIYTVSQKKEHQTYSGNILCQILTDFLNSFTDRFFMKFVVKWLLKIPLHLKRVATLPCEKEASCCWASAAHANDVQPVCHSFGGHVEAGRHRPDLLWSRSKGELRLLVWCAPVTAAVANDAWHVRWVLHLSTGQRSCTPGTWHCATSRASNTWFHFTGSVAVKQSRPQSSWLQDMEHRPAASVSVTGAQCWWTQAAFGAGLALHRPDHH